MLGGQDLPALHSSADATSLTGQKRFLFATNLSFVLLGVAAVAGAFTITLSNSADLAGIVAALAFLLALLIRIYLLTAKPERRWYEGRAAAESVKTLAWRYAVRGEPFVADLPAIEVDGLFAERLRDTLTDLGDVDLEPAGHGTQITDAMRTMRARMNTKVAGSEYGRESTLTLTLRRSLAVICGPLCPLWIPIVVICGSPRRHRCSSVFSVDPHRRRALDRVPISRVRC